MPTAGWAGAFLRHRGLIAFSAGGAMAEAAALCFLAPEARALAPQVTALPPLAAYHDLRWLFAFNQSWPGFTAALVLLLAARSVIDAALVRLAWPRDGDIPRPRFLASALSCGVLTVVVWLLLSPVVTLMFGVALVPFSWPYLAAVPILLGTVVALCQGGVERCWWRRLPPARTVAWLLATFAALSAASLLAVHLDAAGTVAVAGLAGLVNARAWYGLTAAAARRAAGSRSPVGRRRGARGGRAGRPPRLALLPVAPIAALLVLALMVAVVRLSFTGTVRFTSGAVAVAGKITGASGHRAGQTSGRRAGGRPVPSTASAVSAAAARATGAVLVVGGFGSTCCDDVGRLRADLPRMVVRQFSYRGLNPAGQPIPYGSAADDLPIQVLGDRMAAQVERLHARTGMPVDIVAESEGTLGLYAMLARHPHVPVGSLVLLSPIVEPGQLSRAGAGVNTVPGAALLTLNDLVAGMSPYGPAGAQALITSVSMVGARYFARVSRDASRPWLAVVPLADAVTLPACRWPPDVVFVPAFHGGLLGDSSVQPMVMSFLAGAGELPQQRLRRAAGLISAAATAWRMPDFGAACPAATS